LGPRKSKSLRARQLNLFPEAELEQLRKTEETLWAQTFEIDLLDGATLRLNLETIRQLQRMTLSGESKPSKDL
jgi:hypothetical protein